MKTKFIIALFLVGVFLIGGLFVFYGRGEENVSISEFFSKLSGITGFVTITSDSSADWNMLELIELNLDNFINDDNLMLSIDNKILT